MVNGAYSRAGAGASRSAKRVMLDGEARMPPARRSGRATTRRIGCKFRPAVALIQVRLVCLFSPRNARLRAKSQLPYPCPTACRQRERAATLVNRLTARPMFERTHLLFDAM